MTEPRTDPPLGAELRAGPSPGTSPAASRAAATPPSTPHPGGLVEAGEGHFAFLVEGLEEGLELGLVGVV